MEPGCSATRRWQEHIGEGETVGLVCGSCGQAFTVESMMAVVGFDLLNWKSVLLEKKEGGKANQRLKRVPRTEAAAAAAAAQQQQQQPCA
jgi:hypothetical protein